MIYKSFKGLQNYYLIVVLLIMGFNAAILSYYLHSRLVDTVHTSSIHEAGVFLEELKQQREFEKVQKLVEGDNVRSAVKLLENIESKIKEVSFIRKITENDDRFWQTIIDLKESLGKLLSYSEISAIFKVIEGKVNKLSDLATENKWESLARMSARLQTRFYVKRVYSYDNINDFYNRFNQNTSTIKNIVENSSIQKEDRIKIVSQLDSLQVELSILEKYLKDLKGFNEKYRSCKSFYEKWIDQMSMDLSLEKIKLVQKSERLVWGMWGLLSFIFAALVLGMIVYHQCSKKGKKIFEEEVLEIIRKGVMAVDSEFGEERFSNEFVQEIKRGHYYVQKRMNFSSIFQAAMPFPAILLNGSLKVIWANPLFCETFKIKNFEFEKESLSWDYLIRFTNITENDPVISGLKYDLAGIYQIKIKVDQNSMAKSYEMYVCPVNVSGQKRLMILFYPLTSMEETIINQGLTLIGPVKKALDALTAELYDSKFVETVKSEFEQAGISEVYEKFNRLFEKISTQKQNLSLEINKLEDRINKYHNSVAVVRNENDDYRRMQNVFFANLDKVRQYLISYVDGSNDGARINTDLILMYKNVIKHSSTMTESAGKAYDKVSSTQYVISLLTRLKKDLRSSKEGMIILDSRLRQSLEKVDRIFNDNRGTIDSEMEKTWPIFKRIQNDVKTLNDEVKNFDKILTMLDVQFSKAEMILDGDSSEIEVIENYGKHLMEFDRKVEKLINDQNTILNRNKGYEDKIVTAFDDFFKQYKINIEHLKRVSLMMKEILEVEDSNAGSNGNMNINTLVASNSISSTLSVGAGTATITSVATPVLASMSPSLAVSASGNTKGNAINDVSSETKRIGAQDITNGPLSVNGPSSSASSTISIN